MRRTKGITLLVQRQQTAIQLGLKLEVEQNMYLVVMPHQWETNLQGKLGLNGIMLGGA